MSDRRGARMSRQRGAHMSSLPGARMSSLTAARMSKESTDSPVSARTASGAIEASTPPATPLPPTGHPHGTHLWGGLARERGLPSE